MGDQDDHQEGSKCTKLNFVESKTVDKVNNNDIIEITKESDVIKHVGSCDIIKDDMVPIEVNKNISNNKQSKEVKDLNEFHLAERSACDQQSKLIGPSEVRATSGANLSVRAKCVRPAEQT